MTRSLILAFLLVVAVASWPAPRSAEAAVPADAARYVPGTEDVPLMPGLAAEDGAWLLFDKPQGRIIQAAAHGAVSRRAVLAFYRKSLPSLGWRQSGRHRYLRDGERLSLRFGGSDGNLQVAFSLAPH